MTFFRLFNKKKKVNPIIRIITNRINILLIPSFESMSDRDPRSTPKLNPVPVPGSGVGLGSNSCISSGDVSVFAVLDP